MEIAASTVRRDAVRLLCRQYSWKGAEHGRAFLDSSIFADGCAWQETSQPTESIAVVRFSPALCRLNHFIPGGGACLNGAEQGGSAVDLALTLLALALLKKRGGKGAEPISSASL